MMDFMDFMSIKVGMMVLRIHFNHTAIYKITFFRLSQLQDNAIS
jgi:hypothetical protein